MDDPFDLTRFVAAQEQAWPAARRELGRGRKTSHWMWFIFPQLRGLGRSSTATYYGISGRDEARAYLDHPLLGARLIEAAETLATTNDSAEAIMGPVDALKLRSSMTLFAALADDPAPFDAILARLFGGAPDPETRKLLGEKP